MRIRIHIHIDIFKIMVQDQPNNSCRSTTLEQKMIIISATYTVNNCYLRNGAPSEKWLYARGNSSFSRPSHMVGTFSGTVMPAFSLHLKIKKIVIKAVRNVVDMVNFMQLQMNATFMNYNKIKLNLPACPSPQNFLAGYIGERVRITAGGQVPHNLPKNRFIDHQ